MVFGYILHAYSQETQGLQALLSHREHELTAAAPLGLFQVKTDVLCLWELGFLLLFPGGLL